MATDPRVIASSFLSFDMNIVLVQVGANKDRFAAHLSRLTQTSRSFHEMVERDCKLLVLNLPEEEPAIYEIYQGFIYSGKIAIQRSEEHIANGVGVDAGEYPLLAKLYCFGEKYRDIRFKNTVIDAIIANTKEYDAKGTRWFPTDNAIDILYQGTPPDSPARKLMVDLHIKQGSERWLEIGDNNHQFLIDLASGFWEHNRRIAVLGEIEQLQYANPNARYHEQED